MQGVSILNGNLWLSYSFLKNNGVTEKQLELWSTRKVSIKDDIAGQKHILYNSIEKNLPISFPSQNDLIGMANEAAYDSKKDEFLQPITEAYKMGFIKHREYFKQKYPTLPAEKLTTAAKKYAVWLVIVDLVNEGVRNNEHLYAAYNEVFTGQYKTLQNFANAKSKAIKHGAEHMAIDARWFTAPQNALQVNELNKFWVMALLSIPKKLNYPQILQRVNKMCDKAGEKKMSLSWVKKYGKDILKTNRAVYASRYGKDAAKTRQGYIKTERAQHANTRWFMDGKQIPLYGVDFQRYQLVLIMDDYSRKIIGYAVGETENTIVIMDALKMAIDATNCLPNELISDKHSFHRTSQAAHFKEETEKIGMTFTADTNPQRKATLERHNQTFDSIFKNLQGYTGGGIRSKSADALPTDEYRQQAAENPYSEDAVKLAAIWAVDEFNKTAVKGKTREELYNESEKPHCFTLTIDEKIKVLTAKATYAVRRGRIKITLGGKTYEFEMNSTQQGQYDNGDVIVRYEDLRNSIYVFTADTDEFIAEVKHVPVVYGAKADQTENDISAFNRNKGRLTGVDMVSRNNNEAQLHKALTVNPEAVEILTWAAADKDLRQEFTRLAHLKNAAAEMGIDVENVHLPLKKEPLNIEGIMPAEKSEKSPFSPKNKANNIITIAKKFGDE